MVAAGIAVSKAMLDVVIGEGPVHRFANRGPASAAGCSTGTGQEPHRWCVRPPAGRNGSR